MSSTNSDSRSRGKPRGKYRAGHQRVHDPHKRSRDEASRALSHDLWGVSNDPAALLLSDASALFGDLISNAGPEQVAELHEQYPYVRQLLARRYLPPPVRSEFEGDVEYLRASRVYRATNPTVDKLSKVACPALCTDSTRTKFDLGITTAGCLHVGSGRPTASSVPDAGRRVDLKTGMDLFDVLPVEQLIISDAAVPDEAGLGCGSFPALITWLNYLARQGKQIIAKVTLPELKRINAPWAIVYKPRPHNLEVIVAINIPSVGLDPCAIEEAFYADNARRNQAVFDESLPVVDWDDFTFDESLLVDDRDYSSYDIPEHLPTLYEREQATNEHDLTKLDNMVKNGFFAYSPAFNLNFMRRINAAVAVYQKKKFATGTVIYRVKNLKPERDKWAPEHLVPRSNEQSRHGKEVWGPLTAPVALWADTLHFLTDAEIASVINLGALVQQGTFTLLKDGVALSANKVKKRKDCNFDFPPA